MGHLKSAVWVNGDLGFQRFRNRLGRTVEMMGRWVIVGVSVLG
jgi:hypothetical protein